MNVFISRILRWGVLVSGAVVATGLGLFFVTGSTGYGHGAVDLATLTRAGVKGLFPTTPGELFRGVLALKPFAIAQLGLALLIATPVARVAASVVAFARARDRLYAVITLYVLAVLAVSFLLGQVAG